MSFTAHVHIQQRPHRQYYCSGFAKTVPTRLYRLFQPERQNLPVEEVQIRSIVPLEQFEELMKLLDDIVLFSAATPELATKFQGLWNRLDLPDKDDKDRIECTRMGSMS